MKKTIKILISTIVLPFAILFGLVHFFILGEKKTKVINNEKDSEYPIGTKFTPTIFSLGFVSGHTENSDNGNTYEMHPVYVGDLVLSSGKIVIGEPFFFFDIDPLDVQLESGTYPVYIAEVIIKKKNRVVDKRNALAKVKLSSTPAVTWEYKGSFSVDGGTGGYMDYKSLKKIILNQQFDSLVDDVIDEFHKVYKVPKPFDEKHHLYHQYVDLDYKDGNLIAFSTGWGDGGYNSFIGYDSDGNIVEVLTDLGIIWWEPKTHLTKHRSE